MLRITKSEVKYIFNEEDFLHTNLSFNQKVLLKAPLVLLKHTFILFDSVLIKIRC